MKALTYQLRLLEPVLVSQAETGEENSAIGLPFIPGSALRGALATRYAQAHPAVDLAKDPATRALFLDGTVAFLNAYPAPGGVRLLPTPCSWFTEKDRLEEPQGTLYDWAVNSDVRLKSPKAPKGGAFCLLTPPVPPEADDGEDPLEALLKPPLPATVRFYSPAREVNVHIALVQANTRTDENKVYRYDALAAGERLAGVIVVPDDFDLSPLCELLEQEPTLFLGGAHTAGYGRVQVENIQEIEGWAEYENGPAPQSIVTVTLLSDAILRGLDGQFDADLNGTIARLLQQPDLMPMRRYQRVTLVGGFNRKWGLPLEQTWALQAGSVLMYKAEDVDAARLRALTATGIGERRAEGFGRIAVNWHTTAMLNFSPLTVPAAPVEVQLTPASTAMAQRLAERRLKVLLERALITAVYQLQITHPPQNAQLSRVRTAAGSALQQKTLEPVKEHLKALKGAREQFEKARINGVPLLDWLKERLEKQDVEKQLLQGQALPVVAGQSATLTPALRITYTARLIDAVMQKAARQNQEAKR
ncbi:MAG TPA: type III-B CRISPR module-associated Cmr3 family protein [Anaerolineaceae bacterium]|nr:type III-B CRISPR module-associated Cmr3 family protein [Anaerolineaceae bacterium]